MNNVSEKNGSAASEENLDEVLDAIRLEPVPELNSADLAVPTRHVRASAKSTGRSSKLWPVIAASAALVAFVGFIAWPQSNQNAFAKVQEALSSVKSISYTVMDYHGNGTTHQTDVCYVTPHFSRVEVTGGFTQIFDWQQNMQLVIDENKRIAIFTELDPTIEFSIRRQQSLSMFYEIPEKATRLVGPTTFDGKAAEEFIVRFGDRDFNVIVDSITMLPVQMTFDGAAEGNDGFREVIQDFKFDADVDRTQFQLSAPTGYEVRHVRLKEVAEGGELFTVSPTTGMAPITFGCDEKQVVDFLGEPEARTEHVLSGLQSTPTAEVELNLNSEMASLVKLKYHSHGLQFSFDSTGGLSTIHCQSQRRHGLSVRNFLGQTTEGIRIGDSMDKVREVYGEPELLDVQVARYIRLGWAFYLVNGEVAGIDVESPTPDNLEISVDKEAGSWSIHIKDED